MVLVRMIVPDTCSMLITVEDGQQLSEGHLTIPHSEFCCEISDYLDRVYSSDRVLYPTCVGVGPKECRRFERMSWDARVKIADHFQQIVLITGLSNHALQLFGA